MKLYFRCNGGHYFRDSAGCPFDGWSCDGLQPAIAAFEAAAKVGTPTIEDLRKAGVSGQVVSRCLIIQFGDEASAFEALVPERYLHRSEELLAHEVGSELS